jgi:hypothetical protein
MDSHLVQVLLPGLEELEQSSTIFSSFQHVRRTHLVGKGEESITPQAVRALNSRVPGVHVHQENTQFSID